jgi:hypothetical protein
MTHAASDRRRDSEVREALKAAKRDAATEDPARCLREAA